MQFQSIANGGRRCWKFPGPPIAAQREWSAHGFDLCVCSAAHALEVHPRKIVVYVVQIGPFFVTTRFARNVGTNEVFAGASDRLFEHTGLGNGQCFFALRSSRHNGMNGWPPNNVINVKDNWFKVDQFLQKLINLLNA